MMRFRAGAWVGILGPTLYVATWAVAGALRPDYDPTRQAISELAEIGSATQPWMTAAFLLFGLTAMPFASTLRRALPGDTRAVATTVVVCGLATMAAGLFPCTPGCPGPGSSPTDNGHAVAAIIGYLALMAAPGSAGLLLLRADRTWRVFALWSLAAAAIGSFLMLLWTLGAFGAAGGAGQRGFNTLADVWWVTAGVVALRRGPTATAATLVPLTKSG
ncbi:MAG TPA: DUF998 domain-containing protein [Euzebya sp.]|nr:DUF998 domain-containing protein [Euzebya sp.]